MRRQEYLKDVDLGQADALRHLRVRRDRQARRELRPGTGAERHLTSRSKTNTSLPGVPAHART